MNSVRRMAGIGMMAVGAAVLAFGVFAFVVSPSTRGFITVIVGLPGAALFIGGRVLLRNADRADYRRYMEQWNRVSAEVGEITPVRGTPVVSAMPAPPLPRPAPAAYYVPVAMPLPRRRRRSKENRIYTAIAVLMLLGIAGVYLLPRLMQASRNDAEARTVATTYEGLIRTRIANDLPGTVVSIDLSANLASVELAVEIEDGVLNGRLGAMGVRSMIEMATGQALDQIVVTLITPTDRSTWRWSTLNRTWRES